MVTITRRLLPYTRPPDLHEHPTISAVTDATFADLPEHITTAAPTATARGVRDRFFARSLSQAAETPTAAFPSHSGRTPDVPPDSVIEGK